MMVIGGLGRAEGAVIGAAIVTLIDKGMIELGPLRIIVVAAIMLLVTIFAREGLTGAREQFRDFRKRKAGERRARRTEKGGEAMPEEAVDVLDKQELYYRRFNKRLRERLKTMITPELIAEHQRNPLGHHSDALSRVLNYFRRAEMADKYVIMRLKDGEERYRIMAVSGTRGLPPDIRLFGYSDPMAAKAGEPVDFMISAEGTTEAQIDIVRLIHGDYNPEGPGFIEELIETDLPKTLPVQRQYTQNGAFARVKRLYLSFEPWWCKTNYNGLLVSQ